MNLSAATMCVCIEVSVFVKHKLVCFYFKFFTVGLLGWSVNSFIPFAFSEVSRVNSLNVLSR